MTVAVRISKAREHFLTTLSKMTLFKREHDHRVLLFLNHRGEVVMEFKRRSNILYVHYQMIWEHYEVRYGLDENTITLLIREVFLSQMNWPVKPKYGHWEVE